MIERNIQDIQRLVETELARIQDQRVRDALQSLLVTPELHQRNWEYGKEGEHYPCWTIAVHAPTQTALVFSDYGFGPRMPWGLVWMNDRWFGMDSGWFPTLEEAFRDSMGWEDRM
jgi:hypothetical protein